MQAQSNHFKTRHSFGREGLHSCQVVLDNFFFHTIVYRSKIALYFILLSHFKYTLVYYKFIRVIQPLYGNHSTAIINTNHITLIHKVTVKSKGVLLHYCCYLYLYRPGEIANVDEEGDVGVATEIKLLVGEALLELLQVATGDDGDLLTRDGSSCRWKQWVYSFSKTFPPGD